MADRNLAAARAAVGRFNSALDQQDAFGEVLAREYHRAKRALALSFQEMALSVVPREQFKLDEVKQSVMDEMRSLFAGRVDPEFFTFRRYTTPHPDIYALLASQVGEPIPGWRIRLLSGDKIHTERRTRELRDLGLEIEVNERDDESTYCLVSLDADLRYGAAFQLRENALRSKKVSGQVRSHYVEIAEQTAVLPQRKST